MMSQGGGGGGGGGGAQTSMARGSSEEPSPRGSSEEMTSPRGSSEEPTSPRGSSEGPTSPRGSSEGPTSPRGSSEETTSPRGRSEGPTSPRGSSEGPSPGGSLRELEGLVSARVRSSSWMERHGWDWMCVALGLACIPAGLALLSRDGAAPPLLGCACLAVTHALFTMKAAHLASHDALVDSRLWSRVWCLFFVEVCGCFPADVAVAAHIKVHHAYTNVLGLGDSSMWRAPFLPRYAYLFLAPLALPFITPAVTIGLLLQRPTAAASARTLALCALGLGANFASLRCVCGLGAAAAAACMYVSRAAFSIPYIHVNVFQHLGLAMFARDRCPRRLVQMAHGVLNLRRVRLLDLCFGHSLVSCHVEHHLFPALSDHMCLQIKPLVSSYLKSHGQPYHEASYSNRLRLFIDKYEEFLVQLPPITELAGLQ